MELLPLRLPAAAAGVAGDGARDDAHEEGLGVEGAGPQEEAALGRRAGVFRRRERRRPRRGQARKKESSSSRTARPRSRGSLAARATTGWHAQPSIRPPRPPHMKEIAMLQECGGARR